jgi:hypothetical protein
MASIFFIGRSLGGSFREIQRSPRLTLHDPCQFVEFAWTTENREFLVRDEPAIGYTLLN